ncbi:aldose epimerase [Pantoea ananatis]|jgi:aldose 1-epimerase|uniref:aldose-1-epimerase n=1 Tax=Pantoea ananas TaxID=553 RepID=UPI00073723D4|nr:aldose-1-epimerase [Pantoea ananatis]KTR48245.1 aldose epimerase [Pantoea ananatis]KTR52478.1 aldose epimerase [Pantoea ananatis]KTR61821.1 aldose epimerase [Pantoea ananatis]KTR67446.1 aldose epimerase [Pantoea ananatis]MBN6030458.1 aldose-1-epimerase [Pantoea ananatis]
MHSSGQTLVLHAGEYQAKIVTVGAGLAELTHAGRHLVLPHPPEAMPLAHMGKVLIPWPNRVAKGTWKHNGKRLQLPINDHEGVTAIHGLLAWRDWQVTKHTDSEATLTVFLPPSYGYPFALLSTVTYRLDAAQGLEVSISSQNVGDQPAPYGVGSHPYLTCNMTLVDHCLLTLPAAIAEGDFLTPRRLASTQIDCSVNTRTAGREWEVRLTCPKQALSVLLRSDQPWLQIYSGEKLGRTGLAAEPMSCPPDAFNSGIDVIFLAPQARHLMTFTIGCDQHASR